MSTLNRLPRPLLVSLMAALVLAAAGLTFALYGAGSGVSAQSEAPGTPSNVRPEGAGGKQKYGDKEMRLAWTAPAAGNCAATDYYVRIYKKSDGAIVEQGDTPNTYYVATHLQPSTRYTADVWAYGSSCANYSDIPGTFAATGSQDMTNQNNSAANDPAPPDSQGKAASNRPGVVSMTKSGTSATLNWSAPAADATRCPHTDYSTRLNNHTTNNDSDVVDGITTSTSATFTGLTTGHKYYFEVWSYSTLPCDLYSPVSEMFWTQ